MNDCLFLDNYLMILKSTVEVYVHGTLESSNEDTRKILKKGLDETMKHQASTYDLMCSYGWYSVENVKNSVIEDTFNNVVNKNC